MPSSSCRRRRRRNRKKPPLPPPAPAEAARDWAALPQDILLTIFLKLGDSEQIMQGAELVCKTWRRVAVDEPMLWQRVDMGRVSMLSAGGCAMGCAAIDRGAGQCESFSGRHCSKDLLLYLVERARSLKTLHITFFNGPNEVIYMALKKLPLLEDLEISPLYISSRNDNFFQSVCQACPLLKKLRIRSCNVMKEINGSVTSTMCELRSLELLGCEITTEGLTAILHYCPALESLYITGSFIGDMDAELWAKCSRVKNLSLPECSTEDYDTNDDDERSGREDFDYWDLISHVSDDGYLDYVDRHDFLDDPLSLIYGPRYW